MRQHKDVMFPKGTPQLKCVLKLPYVLLARMLLGDASKMTIDLKLLVIVQGIDMHFKCPIFPCPRKKPRTVSKRYVSFERKEALGT